MSRASARAGSGVALATAPPVGIPAGGLRGGGGDPAVTPAAPTRTLHCELSRLPVPAGMTNVSADGVDPTGTYIVGNSTGTEPAPTSADGKGDGIQQVAPLLWTAGRPQALPKPAWSVYAAEVNAAGTVVAVAGSRHWTSVVRYTGGGPVTL